MNKLENNKINEGALTKQIKPLVMQERYEEAMKVLDEIEVSKIRNISILCLVGEVYMGLKRYDEAEQILLRVYEKNPNTRRILDLLTTLYIDKGEYSEAEYYYKEFIGVASRDLHRYILRYRLDKGKGERLSVLIDTLEKLKDYEYIEEWAYELATLYEASGETKKCIHECDEIVLWFGHGEYVDKAIALKCKLTGEPLPEISTVEQHRVEEEQRAAHEKQLTESIGAEMGIEGFAAVGLDPNAVRAIGPLVAAGGQCLSPVNDHLRAVGHIVGKLGTPIRPDLLHSLVSHKQSRDPLGGAGLQQSHGQHVPCGRRRTVEHGVAQDGNCAYQHENEGKKHQEKAADDSARQTAFLFLLRLHCGIVLCLPRSAGGLILSFFTHTCYLADSDFCGAKTQRCWIV